MVVVRILRQWNPKCTGGSLTLTICWLVAEPTTRSLSQWITSIVNLLKSIVQLFKVGETAWYTYKMECTSNKYLEVVPHFAMIPPILISTCIYSKGFWLARSRRLFRWPVWPSIARFSESQTGFPGATSLGYMAFPKIGRPLFMIQNQIILAWKLVGSGRGMDIPHGKYWNH
jgi:cytochrome bd-type quinol oxidase subunit 2